MSHSGSRVYHLEALEFELPTELAIPYKQNPSKPTSKLEPNDARAREHTVRTQQDDISSRHRRFLQKISEGKRRFLWEAAWPEPPSVSFIPMEKPLFLSNVTISFEPGDLDFEIMPPKPRTSKTP